MTLILSINENCYTFYYVPTGSSSREISEIEFKLLSSNFPDDIST